MAEMGVARIRTTRSDDVEEFVAAAVGSVRPSVGRSVTLLFKNEKKMYFFAILYSNQ